MASSSVTAVLAPVARVVRAMGTLAPLRLAETAWDNVGLLLDDATSFSPSSSNSSSSVFLTIDLTTRVLEEALAIRPAVRVIVAYHPPIFSAWKRLTHQDPKQSIILRCAAAGIAVYSPHTALDNVSGGINDWLLTSLDLNGEIGVITPSSLSTEYPGAGAGRILRLKEAVSLDAVVAKVKKSLGLNHVRVAAAANKDKISRIAVCAGSGASVLKNVDADVLYTGEMSHHDVLAALERGVSVILCEHSNTERGYLNKVLQPRLQELLDADVDPTAQSAAKLHVLTSSVDADPLVVF